MIARIAAFWQASWCIPCYYCYLYYHYYCYCYYSFFSFLLFLFGPRFSDALQLRFPIISFSPFFLRFWVMTFHHSCVVRILMMYLMVHLVALVCSSCCFYRAIDFFISHRIVLAPLCVCCVLCVCDTPAVCVLGFFVPLFFLFFFLFFFTIIVVSFIFLLKTRYN